MAVETDMVKGIGQVKVIDMLGDQTHPILINDNVKWLKHYLEPATFDIVGTLVEPSPPPSQT